MDYKMIRQLPSERIVFGLQQLLKEEKRIGDDILIYLDEVDRRELHTKMGYASLFEFLTRHFAMGESAAYARISSMRLLRSVPSARELLSRGELNLSTLTQVHTFVRQDEKKQRTKWTREMKLELIERVKNKSQREVRRELQLLNPDFSQTRDSERAMNDHEVEITFRASRELVDKLQRIRELASHKVAGASYNELFLLMANETLAKIEKKKPSEKSECNENSKLKDSSLETKVDSAPARSRHVPLEVQRRVWSRDHGECQYKRVDGSRCASRYFVQVEHRDPFSLGGEHVVENLELLCASHNRQRWREVMKKQRESND